VREGNVSSTLDYIFTDETGLIDDIDYLAPVGKSDHVCLSWKNSVQDTEYGMETVQTKMNYWKGDYNAINNELSQVDWNAVVSSGTVDDRWVRFRDLLHGATLRHVPQ